MTPLMASAHSVRLDWSHGNRSGNNSSLAFEGGFGLNLLDGNLTVLALTHDGPEDPFNNHDWRYLNDMTTTWKVNKCLTSITDLNLIVDTVNSGKWGGGVAQYFTYSVNDWLQLGVRGEKRLVSQPS
jgi:hypothetical protein